MSTAMEAAGRGGEGVSASERTRKAALFVLILGGVVALDFVTKLFVMRSFNLYDQVDLIGSYVRLTYIHNPGAAFGIDVGRHSRVVFLVLSLVALIALAGMYWFTPAKDRARLASIALICGGAVGNMLDRIRSTTGVVDFIDVGVGDVRWPVFNFADIGVTVGAIILALSLWKEEPSVDRGG